MILRAARLAAINLFAPETRGAFWKVIGLTIAMLIGLWFLITGVFSEFALPWMGGLFPEMPEWTDTAGFFFGVLASIALAFGLAFLIAPISVVIAGFFLDDVAEAIERRDYPEKPTGRALTLAQSVPQTAKFFGIVILANILAFTLLLVPLVNLVAFLVVNAYLLSREFFEFAAMRYHSPEEARQLRSRYGTTVFLAGLVIAGFLAIPILNLLTPLFAAGLMVHLHQMIVERDADFRLEGRPAEA
jgi:CysZ protein